MKLAIFGTGSSGTRAWQVAQSVQGIRVICFADNDEGKHGGRRHECPVVGADELIKREWDFVLLASQWASDIETQLLGLGVEKRRILAPDLNSMREALETAFERLASVRPIRLCDGKEIFPDELPRVLILTYETLNDSHGTGVLLKRYFRDFPADRLFSLSHTETGQPWLENSAVVSKPRQNGPSQVAALLRDREFVPDLIYATVFNENDLPLLEAALDALRPGIPVIQHFMDYMPHDATAFDQEFGGLLPRVSEVWALTKPLQTMLREKFAKQVSLVTSLQQTLPTSWKHNHCDGSEGFRTVLLGNLWQPWMINLLRDVWAKCREQLPSLGPIEWYVHPQRVQAVVESGYDPGLDIVWRGFITDAALQERLQAADLAIVPFNVESSAANDYARFSLPSRLTELCGAGLPLFAIAGSDTEPSRFVNEHAIGRVVAGEDADAVATALVDFFKDAAAREAAGKNARALAEREFRLEPFQEWLVGHLVEMADASPQAEYVDKPSQMVTLEGSEEIPRASLDDLMRDRIHYACGRNVLDGWLNVDGFDESYPYGSVPPDYYSRIFRMDLTRPHPFPDNSFAFGYSEDFLEHLDQADSIVFLSEAYRTLKPGGVLRLSFPGLPGILKRHLRGSGHSAGSQCREEAYVRWWHKHFYTFDEISEVCRSIGYSKTRECEYGKGAIPEIVQETRPDQADLNLVVELVK